MSERLVLVESDRAGLRAALLEGRRLTAIEIDRVGVRNPVGAVTAGTVVRTVAGVGTIIALPDRTEMLLDRGRSPQALSAGEILTVQIARAPRGGKLGLATRSVSCAGRAVVHLPFETGITISRRLGIDEDRRRSLEALVAGKEGGWIFRRTALACDENDLVAEIAALSAEGEAARQTPPACPAPDAFRRLANDVATPARILVAGLAAQRAVALWSRSFAPSLAARIAPAEAGLFDLHDLDAEIAALANPRVALPAGGSLVIEPTEALTAIDVNAGAESNAITVNLSATTEIARQLRLRHIGGIVVIDFISMSRPRDRERVMEAFRAAVAGDPAQTYIVPISPLGLVEMTRERRGPGLEFDSP